MPVFDSSVFDSVVFDTDADIPDVGQFLWWGPLMPDAAHGPYAMRGPMFPDYAQPLVIPPVGPGGVVSLSYDLEQNLTITLSWVTDIIKSYSGLEQRIAVIDEPKVSFDGKAVLIGDDARSVRTAMAKNAARGSPFLLGLPYEEMTITGTGTLPTQIPVLSTANSDWATVFGQRVLIVDAAGDTIAATIQSGSGSDFIQVDIDVSALVHRGSRVMPEISVLLEPTQGFARSPTPENVQQWQVRARALDYGFRSYAQRASASLAAALPNYTGFLGVAYAVGYGPGYNDTTLAFVGDLASGPPTIDVAGHAYTIHFIPNATTVTSVVNILSPYITFSATFVNVHWRMQAGDIQSYSFSGGLDKSLGLWGNGGTIETYLDKPLWDRFIQVDGTISDSVQGMVEIIDFDGVPMSIGQATVPDWGRGIRIRRRLGPEWQWVKAFLYHICGRQKSFWLSTFSSDIDFLADGDHSAYTMVISTSDFFTWYPDHRQHIQVWNSDDSFSHMEIYSATDNGDGTTTLVCREPAPVAQNAYALFTVGGPGALGLRTTRWTTSPGTSTHPGASGNFGSIELRSDGSAAVDITSDGSGNIVAHFLPGVSTTTDLAFAVIFAFFGEFQWSQTAAPVTTVLQTTDVQGPVPFAHGADVGDLGTLQTLPTGQVKMVSWLELCRLESDDVEVQFEGPNFTMETVARVVQR